MRDTRIPIKNIAKILGKNARAFSEEVKSKAPYYIEFFKTLAGIGSNISLDVDKGLIKVKDGLVNNYLKDVSAEDKGLQSIKITCKDNHALFLVELKKYIFEGMIEIPFSVENFLFSKWGKTITFKFGNEKLSKVKNYQSKIIFWFVSSILSIFFKKDELLKNRLSYQDALQTNPDGTYTIDLNKIPELNKLFKKNIAKIKYWDLITIDKLFFEDGLLILKLSEKNTNMLKTSFDFVELLPIGRRIKPLINRF